MTIENPPKLWLICEERWGSVLVRKSETDEMEIRLYREHLTRECHDYASAFTEPQAYVREDVAAEQTAAAVKAARVKFADMIEKADDLADDLMGRPRASETIDALRRERDALDRRVNALREGLRVIVMRSLASVDDPSVEVMAYEIANHALMLDNDMMADGEDDAAAGKGVG